MYEQYSTISVSTAAGVARVVIDSPPLNLLGEALLRDLDRFTAAVRDDTGIRVIVFESADPDFFVPHGDMTIADDPGSFATWAVATEQKPSLNPMLRLHERIRALPQITIAKLRGLAGGGGAELVSAMDLRFASLERAGLTHMEAPLGIIPGAGGTAYLPRLVGRARALEIILGAGRIDAAIAERYGWINRALPDDRLDDFVDALATRIAALPPGVASAAVESVDAALESLEAGLDVENVHLSKLFTEPAAARLARAALAAGAQTREGERDFESVLATLDS